MLFEVSSIKRRGSGIADPSKSAQADLGIFTCPHLSDCVFESNSLGSQACMLKLKK